MGQSASQAAAFYRDVAKTRKVWTVRDAGGVPAPMTSSGRRSMPFWSSRSRVERIIRGAAAYSGFEPREISWDEFLQTWVPDLRSHRILVGVNWSGKNVVGYDLEPQDVVANVMHAIRSSVAA